MSKLIASPIAYYKALPVTKIEQALRADSLSLVLIKKAQGEVFLTKALNLILADLVLFFNVGKTMEDKRQVTETINLIIQQYYFLKLEDLKICFDGIKSGKYGQLFDRMDGQIILLALKEYSEERMTVSERLQMESHSQLKDLNAVGEKYLVKVDENYVRDTGELYEEVVEAEAATLFDYTKAEALRKLLIRGHFKDNPSAVKVIFKRPEIGLIDWCKTNAPQLVPKDVKYNDATRDYFKEKDAIMNDATLSDFEKDNKVRLLAALNELSKSEWDRQQLEYMAMDKRNRKRKK